MRQAAWDTSTDMLEQVRAEYARLRQQADRDALAIIGEAERDAHKKLATARRDSENKSRTARLETERLLVDARAARDEMMDMAERSTEAAQERTRALERRREELMAELEDLRLQRQAPPDPVGRGVSTTVRVVSAGEPSGTEVPSIAPVPDPAPAADWIDDENLRVVAPLQHAPWADGSETVRLVESPLPAEDDMDVDADEVAGEVARLHAEAETTHLLGEPSDAEREPALTDTDRPNTDRPDTDRPDTVWPDIEMDAPVVATDLPARESIDREVLEPSPERDLAKAWSASDSRPIETGDDLGSLFRELRVDDPATDGVEGEISELASVRPEDNISEDTPLEALIPKEPVTAFDLRDRALLPITNRGLRDIKRQLADVQNLQLDALKRDAANWQPDRDELERRLARELTLMQREAYVAGDRAANEMLSSVPSPGRVDAPDGESDGFISALFDEVVLTVQSGREAGHGARDLGTAVSRVYRVWRTDEAERRMRHLAGRAYHAGLLHAFAEAQVAVRMEVHGSCAECAKVGADGISSADVDTLPVHDECRCTIVPA